MKFIRTALLVAAGFGVGTSTTSPNVESESSHTREKVDQRLYDARAKASPDRMGRFKFQIDVE